MNNFTIILASTPLPHLLLIFFFVYLLVSPSSPSHSLFQLASSSVCSSQRKITFYGSQCSTTTHAVRSNIPCSLSSTYDQHKANIKTPNLRVLCAKCYQIKILCQIWCIQLESSIGQNPPMKTYSLINSPSNRTIHAMTDITSHSIRLHINTKHTFANSPMPSINNRFQIVNSCFYSHKLRFAHYIAYVRIIRDSL